VARALRLAAVTTAILMAGSLLLRVLNPFGAPPADASDWVPHLWAFGSLMLLALTNTWAPTLAWVALVIAASASALASVGLVREVRTIQVDGPAPILSALVAIALVVPPIVAAAYATYDGRRPKAVLVGAWVAAGALSIVLIGSFVSRTMGGERGGVPEWLWLAVIGSLTVLGLARDLGPAFGRTRARLRATGPGAAGDDAPAGRAGGTAFASVRVFLDELVPGREAGRAEAAESERGRLAADLHAEVLPSLRRALAEAETGGTVERLAADLRTAVDEVEALLASRRSIVLEEMGLLAAIEWLAERTEDRSDVRVEILVDGDGGSPSAGPEAARPPREVERAAFRVAQLALDNVVRHAPGAAVAVRVGVSPAALRLRIEDDGDEPAVDEAAAARSGRRGIADMRAEATSCGATLLIARGPDNRGTAVAFVWSG
jgi:signal transduction histidine kinase